MKLDGEEITGQKLFGKPLYEFIDDEDYDLKKQRLIEEKGKIAGFCSCEYAIGSITDDDDIGYCDQCGKPLAIDEMRTVQMSRNLGDSLPNMANITSQKQKVGRNEPCPCGSGKKFKKCCGSASNLHI